MQSKCYRVLLMTAVLPLIFSVAVVAYPSQDRAKKDLRRAWKRSAPGDVLISIKRNKQVNYGRPWKYKKGYDHRRRVIMRYSFPFMVKVKHKGEAVGCKVDVIYVSIGGSPWRFDRILKGNFIRKGAKGKEAPSLAQRKKLFAAKMKKERYMRTQYSNSVKMPPQKVYNIKMVQKNFVDRGKRYWYKYKMFFDVIDAKGKKYHCRKIDATLIKRKGQAWKFYNVGGGSFSKCKPR